MFILPLSLAMGGVYGYAQSRAQTSGAKTATEWNKSLREFKIFLLKIVLTKKGLYCYKAFKQNFTRRLLFEMATNGVSSSRNMVAL